MSTVNTVLLCALVPLIALVAYARHRTLTDPQLSDDDQEDPDTFPPVSYRPTPVTRSEWNRVKSVRSAYDDLPYRDRLGFDPIRWQS